jgi:hypothetical protein
MRSSELFTVVPEAYSQEEIRVALAVAESWIGNYVKYDDVVHPKYGPLQIFRTGPTSLSQMVHTKTPTGLFGVMYEVWDRHVFSIAMTLIFGQEFNGWAIPEGSSDDEPVPIRALRGFVQRHGRLPNNSDRCKLLVLGDRHMKRIGPDKMELVTECTFMEESDEKSQRTVTGSEGEAEEVTPEGDGGVGDGRKQHHLPGQGCAGPA